MSNPDNKELLPPKTCKWCGFEIADRARGTFTAWLFREVCKCEYQQELQLDENASVTPSAEPVQSTTSSFRLGDRYTVLSVLGRGGMGTVVKVRERSSGATLAIKILHVELCQDEISRKRFEREIEAAMSLDHVNLVTVRGHGSTEDGRPFYIMDLIVGKGLSTILAEEKTIEPIRLINIVSQISHALEHVHSHGIVHRDLKPSNIMLVIGHGEKDLVKLVDFGIAKVVRGGERQSNAELNTLTESGEIFGSPLYMSPEQCMGRQLDARSDLYALGCVVYECLTGFPPFPGKNPVETILGHLNDTPKKITVDSRAPDVVQRLENITLKCLAKRVEDRYASVNELIDDLERVRAGLPPAARPRRSRWILKQKKFG